MKRGVCFSPTFRVLVSNKDRRRNFAMRLTQPLRLGILLTTIGILLTTTATAQPQGKSRDGESGNRMKMMMERLDTNQDGVISEDEFKGPSDRFAMMDGNGDGKVNGKELTTMQERMRQAGRRGGRRRGGNRQGGRMLAQRHGVDKSPEVGQKVPDFTLHLLDSEKNRDTLQSLPRQASRPNAGQLHMPSLSQRTGGHQRVISAIQRRFRFLLCLHQRSTCHRRAAESGQ